MSSIMNYPADMALYATHPRSPDYDTSRDDAEQDARPAIREEMIEAITKGYSVTESGAGVPLFEFAEFVLGNVESGHAASDDCRRLILWTLEKGDSGADDVRWLRELMAHEYVTRELNL